MNGTAHSQRTMSHDPSNVDSTLRILDLRHELADVKDRLRQSIDLLELSRDTIVQLRSYSTSLEQLCMWSEASWRSIALDLLHSQCASTWLSLKGSLLSRPVTTSTSGMTERQYSHPNKVRNVFESRGSVQTPPLSLDIPSRFYEAAMSALDNTHKAEHLYQAIVIAEQNTLVGNLTNEIQRVKAEMRVERYKLNQREDARDKQLLRARTASVECMEQHMDLLNDAAQIVVDRVFASADLFASSALACLIESAQSTERYHHQRHIEDNEAVVERHLDYMETIAQRLEAMCMVVGTDDVLSEMSGHRRHEQQILVSARSARSHHHHANSSRSTSPSSMANVRQPGREYVEPSRLEALLLMSPGGD